MATLKVDGKIYENVKKIKAKTDTETTVDFVDTSDATATASDITSGKSAYVNGEIVIGTNTHTEPNDLDGIIDGTITDFVMPNGKTKISPYRFYEFTSLNSINLGGVKEIGNYAFYECRNIDNIVQLPATITKIGDYAMNYLGLNKTSFQFHPADLCTIGSFGCSYAKISKIIGKFSLGSDAFRDCRNLTEIDAEFTAIGSDAFYGCSSLVTVKMKVNGAIGSYAFYQTYQIKTVEISPDSVITSLGSYCFARFGNNRTNPETNIIILDFSKSTFSVIPNNAFGGDSNSNKNRYMKITFPATVDKIEQYAFRYSDNCEYYFTSKTPPTLSATTSWNNATNYNIFVPFGSINAYKTASNWIAQTDYMKGYAPAGTFSVGYTLPELNIEGYALTWYSDKACTTQVTTVTDANVELYCLAGDEKLGYGIKSISAYNCTVSVTDSNGKSYVAGEGVRTSTVLTITGTPTIEGDVPYMFKVNGADFESGSSITVSDDISVTAIYWDGVNLPINPTFADNHWTIIFSAFRAGTASGIWNVGDTKPFTSKSGKNYTLRIADMTAGRYNLADGSGTTNGVLEFVELYNLNGTTRWKINNTTKEGQWAGGGYAMSDMANIYLQQIFDDLPDDLQSAISEITLNEYSFTSPSPRSGNHKLFLPAETEMFDARHNSSEGLSVYPKYTQFGYYVENNTNAARTKYYVGTTSNYEYWLRSPISSNTSGFCTVSSSGSYAVRNASYTSGVAVCFAI